MEASRPDRVRFVLQGLRPVCAGNCPVTLYDLTNTYFEGAVPNNRKAAHGHSKEKRSDCRLVTLGLVVDGSGFVRSSRTFAGNVTEANTLETMLRGLKAPWRALVVMDAGIATDANIDWLCTKGYRYIVVSRERSRQFNPASAIAIETASGGAASRSLNLLITRSRFA